MSIIDDIERLILNALKELKYIGIVDRKICEDIYIHWKRDLKKLSDNHDNEGVSPPKIIGYFSFWLRKLQPISCAQPTTGVIDGEPIISERHTNAHINELVSIYVIKLLLIGFFNQERLLSNDNAVEDKKYAGFIESTNLSFDKLLASLDKKSGNHSFIHVFLYDMRYRTFGPHHLTHVVRYLLERAEIGQSSSLDGYSMLGIGMQNKLSHMRIFISAPGDIQAKISLIEDLIYKNHKRWIKTHNVMVSLLTMQDLSSELDKSKLAQVAILKQIKGKFDVYLGLIDSKFGTPITDLAVGSGTEAEYQFAISDENGQANLDGKFIMFGRSSDAKNVMYGDLSKAQKDDFDKIDAFFSKIGSNGQFYFEWNKKNFAEKILHQVEEKIILFKEQSF